MKYAFPTESEPLEPWFEPLHLVAAAIAGNRLYRFFDCDDFMLMGRVVRTKRPDITLFKHRYTRRYLNLDATGRPYRYTYNATGLPGWLNAVRGARAPVVRSSRSSSSRGEGQNCFGTAAI